MKYLLTREQLVSLNENVDNEDELELSMLPDFLYHVSPIENEQSILKNGIKTNTNGTTVFKRIYSPRVYLATSLMAAYDLQTNFNSHNSKNYLIYKIDKSKLNKNCNIREDSKFAHGIWIDKNVSPNAIVETIDPNTLSYNDEDLENLYNTTWHNYINESNSNKDNLVDIFINKLKNMGMGFTCSNDFSDEEIEIYLDNIHLCEMRIDEQKEWVGMDMIDIVEPMQRKGYGYIIYQTLLDSAIICGFNGIYSLAFDVNNTGQQRSPAASALLQKLLNNNNGKIEEVDEDEIDIAEMQIDDIPFYGPPYINYYITKK